MTKKTNSLIIRYGASTLWKNKNTSMETLTNITRLDRLIIVWLRQKNFNVLNTRYKSNLLNIFVYNQNTTDGKFKIQLLSHYKKSSDLNLVSQKFGIDPRYLVRILSQYNIKKIGVFIQYKKKVSNLFWVLFYKRQIIAMLYSYVLLYEKIKKTQLLIYKAFSRKLISIFGTKKTPNIFFSRSMLLRKINGILKLSLLSKALENVISALTKKEIQLKINNILLKKGFLRIPVLGKELFMPEFRFKFFTVFLSLIYSNSRLIGEFLAKVITRDKQHRKSLAIFTAFVEKIIFSKAIPLFGLQLRVTGKLGGKMRKSKFHYKIGFVKLQTLKYSVSYSCEASYTKFGIISVKVWLVKFHV